ncbi:MAG: class I SAM-dependent methyltransferase [Candidatus Shapirobacteria bacterium]|nr:class I SAM-dependent methyltransferase [Candidatus Shapirobacteria bacterium]
MLKFRRDQFGDFVKRYNLKNKKVMEVGCGKGEYLKLMRETGAEVYGIENADESVVECKKNNLVVKKGFVESTDYRFFKTPVEAFFILNFLEHLPEINNVLRGIRNNLNPGGLGLIEVPYFDLERKMIFTELVADHLFYFTLDSLRYVLEFNGFEILEMKVVWHGFIVSVIVRKRTLVGLANFEENKERLGNEIAHFFAMGGGGGVAIWGASHQALEILSLYNFNDKVKFVIDSAKFKQGKFTPASHVPIVSPEYFDSHRVKAMLILAAGYSEEVSKIIRNKYGNKINLALIKDMGLEILK